MAYVKANLGRIVFMWKGDFESKKQYYLYDIVRVGSLGLFFCTKAHISTDETKPSDNKGNKYWDIAVDFNQDITIANSEMLGGLRANSYLTIENFNDIFNQSIENINTKISKIDDSLDTKADKNLVNIELDKKANITTLSNYYTKSQADNLLSKKGDKLVLDQKADKSALNSYYTKTQTDNLLNKKADKTALDDYYTKTQINAVLKAKADKGTSYTIDKANELLNAKADKSELNNKADKSEITNINNQITEINTKISQTSIKNLVWGTEKFTDLKPATYTLRLTKNFVNVFYITSNGYTMGLGETGERGGTYVNNNEAAKFISYNPGTRQIVFKTPTSVNIKLRYSFTIHGLIAK